MARDDTAAFSVAVQDMTATADKLAESSRPENIRAAAILRERRDRLIAKVNAGVAPRTPKEMQRLADAAVIAAVEGHRHEDAGDVPPELAELVPEGVEFPHHPSIGKTLRHPIDSFNERVDDFKKGVKDTAKSAAIGVGAVLAVVVIGGALLASRE